MLLENSKKIKLEPIHTHLSKGVHILTGTLRHTDEMSEEGSETKKKTLMDYNNYLS